MSSRAVVRVSSRIAAAEMGEATPLLQEKMSDIPAATFTMAKTDSTGRRIPQAIAHRGYKAAFPENTMGAFKGAVEIGAHAIETDLHLTKDGVIVLSHDADLKRCFGLKDKVLDCEWSYLKTLRTLKEPHQPMPRLLDLLQYLATPGLEDIWLLLDIKLDNDEDDIMRLIASTIAEVEPSRPWNQRIVLGCWAAKYVPICTKYLPGFPITHIGFSLSYARQFLKVPNVSFNMLQKVMVGPFGAKFLRDCKRQKRAVYLWTVNEEYWMRWSIKREVDGVLTDDPKKYIEVCKDYDSEIPLGRISVKESFVIIWINALVVVFGALFRLRFGYGSKEDAVLVKEQIQSSGSSRPPTQTVTAL